ncbi:BBP7 family outer membrane beta-barrel protein [Bythopirellula goksoeyrii]|uniref:Uncharacterized protein n=1 Tax=Bythopirellula goksoeyrii TaxID=1400387 RepID=A0A5B9Q526_9BACT|nr:BBP7 family outer membrane beta-barrel protein [Bythopirellula goksoeyrii]QEG34144.1 hypothetical protein Pr1d_14170 [Bythopirellula goksoeyrii]
MTVARYQSYAVLGAAYLLLFAFSLQAADAQQQRSSANGTNRTNETDRAAGNMLDAIFDNPAPVSRGGNYSARRVSRTRPANQPKLQAKLVRNSSESEGTPPYALVDRYGGVLRYVEPVDRVDLKPYLGKVVGVKHDTGDVLLASQLMLPSLSNTKTSNGVQLAAFQEPIPAGTEEGEALLEPTPADDSDSAIAMEETYSYDGSFDGDPLYLGDEGFHLGGYPDGGHLGCDVLGGCGAGVWQPSRVYLRGEYLLWWFDGMDTPPLVTTTTDETELGAILPNPGVEPGNPNYPRLTFPDTSILYGGNPILEDSRSGFRVSLGSWIDDERKQALEADYLYLGTIDESFTAGGVDGTPIISRPYFELVPFFLDDEDEMVFLPPREAAEQVSSALLNGDVTVTSSSEFQGAGFRLRHNLCRCGAADICCGDCVGGCGAGIACGGGIDCGCGPIGCGSCCGPVCGDRRYVDFLLGFRWYGLQEQLQIFEDLEVNVTDPDIILPDDFPPNGTRTTVLDRFSTSNDFTGGELGFDWGIERNRWSLSVLSKIGIGNNHQKVSIAGQTTLTPVENDPPPPQEGGLLAQVSNIGDYERDSFCMIPEINLNLGYKLTPNLKLIGGYTLLYWTDVVRPGDQIDREINGTLVPRFGEEPNAVIPPFRPQFVFNETNMLIQGFNLGGEYSW